MYCSQSLPEFGPYLKKKEELISNYKKSINPLEEFEPEVHRPAYQPKKPVPTVKVHVYTFMYRSNDILNYCLQDVIGRALPMIGAYNDLDNTQQAVALIDEDLCINCGKCYMVCNDSGYQVSQRGRECLSTVYWEIFMLLNFCEITVNGNFMIKNFANCLMV